MSHHLRPRPDECVLSHGVLGGQVVDAFKRDDPTHAELVAHNVASRLRNWQAAIPNVFRTGAELEHLRSLPVDVCVEREMLRGPAGELHGPGFVIVVKPPVPCPEKFKTYVLDRLPVSIDGLTIICEV